MNKVNWAQTLIILTLCIFFCPMILLGHGNSIPDTLATTFFFTNRDSAIEDTIYLPVRQDCLLSIDVYRFIDKVQKIDNNQYMQSTYLYESSLKLQDMDTNIVNDICWMPKRYKRILPVFTMIYNVNDASELNYDKTKEQLIDVVHLRQDTLFAELDYWGSEYRSEIGDIISDYMPMIEMFLLKKISEEITLIVSTNSLITERIFIHVLPSINTKLTTTDIDTPKKSKRQDRKEVLPKK